jgi:hypothetical protein
MNYLFIIIPAIIAGIVLLYIALQGAVHVEEEDPFVIQEEPKFKPRKVTDLSKAVLGTDPYEEEKPIVGPKKKKTYYKKRPTKKSE